MEEQIGRYRIVSELGRGGMGVVYRAHEESLNRSVAIKVLGEHLSEDDTYVQRFVREAQSAAKLNHPNIVQIYAIDEHEGKHYFVMEYVTGTSVYRRIKNEGKLAPTEAARLVLQAASGLAAAHDAGIIHRDIKPANLMIDERGLLKIADFGLALMTSAATKLTATGMFLGTPGYLSPEQCLDQGVDHRTDIYSLGVAFFEMLTGVIPFKADSPLALIKQIIEVQPPDVSELNPDVDETAKAILQRMMAKDRDQRYQSCHELISDLQSYLGQAGVSDALVLGTPAATRTAAAGAGDPAGPADANTMPTVQVSSTGGGQAATPPPPPPAAATAGPFSAGAVPPPVAAAPSDAFAAPPVVSAAPPSSSSRQGLIVVLVLAAVGLALLAGGTAIAWKTGLLGSLLGDGKGDQTRPVADASPGEHSGELQAAATGDDAGEPGTAQDATGVKSTAMDGQALAVAGDSSGEPLAYDAPPAAGDQREALAANGGEDLTRVAAAPAGSAMAAADQQPPTTTGAVRPAGGGAARRDRDLDAAARRQPLPPPRPRPSGIAVVAVGENLLAGEVEAFLEGAMRQRGRVQLIDEKTKPEIHRLLNATADPNLGDLLAVVQPHARFMLLIRAEYLGDRQLRYMGRFDTVHQSRLTIVPYSLESGDALGPGLNEKVEYNQLSVERKVEELLQPRLRRLVAAIQDRND